VVVCGNVIPLETELLEHRDSGLGGVVASMGTLQQLVRDLRLLNGGVLNGRRPVTALGVKDAELIGVRLGPWPQSQPLGREVQRCWLFSYPHAAGWQRPGRRYAEWDGLCGLPATADPEDL
jgi:hypothetical protein